MFSRTVVATDLPLGISTSCVEAFTTSTKQRVAIRWRWLTSEADFDYHRRLVSGRSCRNLKQKSSYDFEIEQCGRAVDRRDYIHQREIAGWVV